MLVAHDLVKRYRRGARSMVANDGISLTVTAGEVVGLLGHNGAGKTTFVNQIVGLAMPTSGTLTLAGHDIVANPAYARSRVSLQPQGQVPLDGVTPRQAIEILGRIRGGDRARVRARTTELLTTLELNEWANTVGNQLSGGVQRLVGFCMAAVEPGRLVVLDEPSNDVDPVRRVLLWREVHRLSELGAAVLVLDYTRALPVPRLVFLLADLVVWLATTVPGLVTALVVAAWRFDLDYSVSPAVVPAFLLTAVAAIAIGYGVAYALSPPATALLTQLLVFLALLFSPITFPASRLPGWLTAVHEVLPFAAMADIVRGALIDGDSLSAWPWILVALWGVGGLTLTYTLMVRRT